VTSQNDCILKVGGRLYGGWKDVRITRSIEQIAGCFTLELTARWPGEDAPLGLREGLPCEVLLGDDLVITGYIDEYEPDLTKDSSRVRIEGRDKTSDLVDCAAIHKSGAWRGAKLEQIVRDLVAPFGLKVEISAGLDTGETFKRFALEDGERAFDAIDRACRLRAVLCTSTAAGALLLTEASEEQSGVTLEEGVNIERIKAVHSWKDRFSQVTVKAQSPGDDDEYGPAVAHPKATAKDAEIDRYRPLVVMAEHHTSNKALAERAGWEVLVRMGRGKRGECTVTGWRTGKSGIEGPLWQPNTLVHLTSSRMTLDADMLIVGCEYQLGPDGTTTTLTFARPEAFALVPQAGARRRLGRTLGDRVKHDKKHKEPGYSSPWDLTPPKEIR
jgi:prophage tail gpP-like protein